VIRANLIHYLYLTAMIASGILLAGCDSRPKRVPISGTVFIDGKPVKGGEIRFIPDHARSAQAEIDKEGHFTLFTFDYQKPDGAVVGEHRVEIRAGEKIPGGIRWTIPKKYGNAASSGLAIKVDKPDNNLRIDLTWAGEQQETDAVVSEGDAAPVGAVPAESAPAAPPASN
jgi:hypothetical protein